APAATSPVTVVLTQQQLAQLGAIIIGGIMLCVLLICCAVVLLYLFYKVYHHALEPVGVWLLQGVNKIVTRTLVFCLLAFLLISLSSSAGLPLQPLLVRLLSLLSGF